VKVKVRCTVYVDVEVPDHWTADDVAGHFEEACPGTGVIGRMIEDAMADGAKRSVCWACNLHGACEVLRAVVKS
jgi:hypothetical protein